MLQSRTTTMEEVWNDINLASLTDHHSSRDHNHTSSLILQDFLATSKDPPSPHTTAHVTLSPATVLTLNSSVPHDNPRHKRMIKNRESAARSRARKQAYTNELELEVAHLLEENARLRRQQQQLRVAATAQLPKNHTLQRTSTAPF